MLWKIKQALEAPSLMVIDAGRESKMHGVTKEEKGRGDHPLTLPWASYWIQGLYHIYLPHPQTFT